MPYGHSEAGETAAAITATSRGQRARTFDARTQQLELHAQLANPLHGRGELTTRHIRLALLERAIQRGFCLLPPALELVERNAEFA